MIQAPEKEFARVYVGSAAMNSRLTTLEESFTFGVPDRARLDPALALSAD